MVAPAGAKRRSRLARCLLLPGDVSRQLNVLIADSDPRKVQWLAQCLGGRGDVGTTSHGSAALVALDRHEVGVLIVGRQLRDMAGETLLAAVQDRNRHRQPGRRVAMIVDGPAATTALERDESGVYYVLQDGVPANDVRAIVKGAIGERKAEQRPQVASATVAVQLRAVLDAAHRLAVQRDLAGATRAIVAAAMELAGAARARCLFYEGSSGTLWAEGEATEISAALGLGGFAARTGRPVVVARGERDPRYSRSADDPLGQGSERLLAQPLAGPDGHIHAVLIAVRDRRQAEFGQRELSLLATFAEYSRSAIHQLSLRADAEHVIEERQGEDNAVFSREAVEARGQRGQYGALINVAPPWVPWCYRGMMALVVAVLAYLYIGTVDQHSTGRAVIRMSGRIEVAAPLAGAITSIRVAPGQRVVAGEVLASYADEEQRAALARAASDFETQLRNRLLDPTNESASQALQQARLRKEAASAELHERELRAHQDGVVSGVRIRAGQHVQPGDVILSLVAGDGELTMVAFLPGADRPQLAVGQRLQLSLDGYEYVDSNLTIDSISADVLGPAEARRYLGPQLADVVRMPSTVVRVEARLPAATFTARDRLFHFHDGMQGSAQVRVSSERIVAELIPGLKGL